MKEEKSEIFEADLDARDNANLGDDNMSEVGSNDAKASVESSASTDASLEVSANASDVNAPSAEVSADASDVNAPSTEVSADAGDVNAPSAEVSTDAPAKKKRHHSSMYSGKKVCRSNIGGQAVIEGVMMRGERSMATAVRESNGNIAVESVRIKSVKEKNVVFRIPFIRGIFNFGVSMVSGVKTLMRSAEVYAGEEEASKTEKWLAKKFKINVMDIVMGFSVVLGLLLSIGLFFFLPLVITDAFRLLDTANTLPDIFWNFIDGALRMLIFVLYIWLTALIPDVKRTFMYHGAEHKTISCYEHGLDLTVENAQKMTTIHDRCGTTFMFLVMVISILVFSLTGFGGGKGVGAFFLRFLVRLALLPVVAGISYEILKFLARFDNAFVRVIKWPGLLLQKLTTKQPTDDMLECAITAFKTVMAMDADTEIEESKFDVKLLYKKSREEFIEVIGESDENEARLDWILVSVLGIKRSELDELTHIRQSDYDKVMAKCKELKAGRPLQHVIGDTSFYGYTIKTDSRALIPRPETEYLVEAVIKAIKARDYTYGIDMCTGTGAIAIALSKEVPLDTMVAVDVSKYALELARENVAACDANVTVIESNLFENIGGRVDFIVSNPPYIKSEDIKSLDSEVKDFEPMLALDGGADGLDFYRRIVKDSVSHLNENGLLAFEVGIGEAESVKELMQNDFTDINIVKDLEGIDRIVMGYLK